MDAVYILGDGSLASDDEIKYSVRSLHKHMRDLGAIYVIGHLPKTLPFVKHIPAEDSFKERWKNALHKINLACEDIQLSQEFLLMNDDFFLNAPFDGAEFPFYCLNKGNGGSSGTVDYALHCPIRIYKEWWLNMPLTPELTGNFSPRTFYANFYRATGTPTTDCIIRVGKTLPDYDTQILGRPWFSISNDTMLHDGFRQWLHDKYPDPSPLE